MKRFLLLSIPLLMVLLTACPEPTPPNGTKPTINSFTASQPSLPAGGGSVTLSWDVQNATTLSIDGGVGAVTGTSKTVSVTSNKTFTLTATNDGGSVTQTTSVSVGAGADTTPPTVNAIDPNDGAIGVLDDQTIVIMFSEQMDQAATEAAYESEDLPPTDVTFSWNVDSTILTIQPNDFLEYAAGDDPSIEAITYSFSIASTATDVAGNSLGAFNSSFSTLKVIVTSIYATADLDGEVLGVSNAIAISDSAVIRVGTTGDSLLRGFLSFDLSDIPANIVADEARLIINKEGVTDNPYEFSDMTLDHVIYGGDLSGDDYDTPVLSDLGIFDSASEPATGYLARDVTSALNDDLSNREVRDNRSQYRLRFPISDGEKGPPDYVSFTASEGPDGQRPFLNIVYYLP